MRSSICVFYIALFWLPSLARAQPASAAAVPQAAAGDPDALYRDRANVASAKQAVGIWDARLKANGSDFESAWKLARAMYWLGTHDTESVRRADLERGVEAGRKAAML